MNSIKKVLSDLPNMADIKLDDSIQLSKFRIMSNIAANEDSNESYNYSFLNEIVEINGNELQIQDILMKKHFFYLIDLENYLAKYGIHITSIYECP